MSSPTRNRRNRLASDQPKTPQQLAYQQQRDMHADQQYRSNRYNSMGNESAQFQNAPRNQWQNRSNNFASNTFHINRRPTQPTQPKIPEDDIAQSTEPAERRGKKSFLANTGWVPSMTQMKDLRSNIKGKVKGIIQQSSSGLLLGMHQASEVIKDKAALVKDSLGIAYEQSGIQNIVMAKEHDTTSPNFAGIAPQWSLQKVDEDVDSIGKLSKSTINVNENQPRNSVNLSLMSGNPNYPSKHLSAGSSADLPPRYIIPATTDIDTPQTGSPLHKSIDFRKVAEENPESLTTIYNFVTYPPQAGYDPSKMAKIRSAQKPLMTCNSLSAINYDQPNFTDNEHRLLTIEDTTADFVAFTTIVKTGPVIEAASPEVFSSVFSPSVINLMTASRLLALVELYGASGLASEYFFISNTPHMDTFKISNLSKNASKNRYMDILCYDSTRVKLNPDDPTDKFDYINASYVEGYNQKRAYICCQGPTENTCNDFWKMIWLENVRLIVMTTRLKEKKRVKCAEYWPEAMNEAHRYEDYIIINSKVVSKELYNISSLIIKSRKTNEMRRLFHILYLVWPDYGVPTSADDFLSLVFKSRELQSNGAGFAFKDGWKGHPNGPPLVIHCSAGVGRSGTYMCSDICMRMLDDIKLVNIPEVLKLIRQQRAYAVQTSGQYMFCYQAVITYAKMIGLLPANIVVPSLQT